ncbi:MAG: efflux RND transporter periplasmic adaptor subunit [Deltaproteobacteria bacterium]|nr:efflux RND transporter periplasmic adaptor subunit [Deltaproteobacteria bacterium]
MPALSRFASKALGLVALWAGLAVLAGGGCGSAGDQPAAVAPPDTPVTVGEVVPRRVEYLLERVGTLQSSDQVTLRAELAASVDSIAFTQGGDVKAGELLVKLDGETITSEIHRLEAQINQLEVRLANQKRTLERNRPLVKEKLVSQLKFDELETGIKEAELAVTQARAELSRQQELLADTEIRAPFAGVVGAKTISVGDYLKAGDPVVTVVDLDPLELSFQVPERYKSRLSLGQTVKVRVASEGEKALEGQIFFIAPLVDTSTRTFQVKARVANPQRRLNPGMFARVELVTEVHPDAATVPWDSIIQTEDEAFLYTVTGGVAHKVPIKLGWVTTGWAEVLAPPLPPGSQVVRQGKFAAKDGQKVSVKTSPTATPTTSPAPAAPAGKAS